MSNEKYKYEERLVAYIDITGWVAVTSTEELCDEAKQALIIIDKAIEAISADDIKYGLYSDALLISMPIQYGQAICSIGNICRQLLAIGFLCTGGITKGLCYHKDNRVVGPAINEVVALEKQNKLPRILCSESITCLSQPPYINSYITKDYFGRAVVNLFTATNGEFSDDQNREIKKIKKLINKNINIFQKKNDLESKKRLEKWIYARALMKSQIAIRSEPRKTTSFN